MTVKPATIKKRIDAFKEKWGSAPFTRYDFATTTQIPVGTASSTCSHAARLGLLSHNSGRPRKYSFSEPKVKAQTPSIDILLDLVAEIESRGVKRSTIAPLLIWIAEALQQH